MSVDRILLVSWSGLKNTLISSTGVKGNKAESYVYGYLTVYVDDSIVLESDR